MLLKIRVEHMKDATKKTKRVIISTLETEIPGMERITAVAELDDKCQMGKEIDDLVERMVLLKKEEIKSKRASYKKLDKKKNERKNTLQKDGSNKKKVDKRNS